jgi:hypothetical protein
MAPHGITELERVKRGRHFVIYFPKNYSLSEVENFSKLLYHIMPILKFKNYSIWLSFNRITFIQRFINIVRPVQTLKWWEMANSIAVS